MSEDLPSRKRALRAELRERRRLRTASQRAADADLLTANLLHLVGESSASEVSAYLSLPDEPPTREFVARANAAGVRVLLPVSREDGLLDWAPYDGATEIADAGGIPAPTSELLGPMAVDECDLLLIPAACVDRSGVRLGWGRGYFDKTLGSMERCPPVYAVIFDDELVDSVPRERHDQPVNGVVMPSGIVTF